MDGDGGAALPPPELDAALDPDAALALDEVCQKFPDRYVDNYVMLAGGDTARGHVKHSSRHTEDGRRSAR
jgi:hypothetical protein